MTNKILLLSNSKYFTATSIILSNLFVKVLILFNVLFHLFNVLSDDVCQQDRASKKSHCGNKACEEPVLLTFEPLLNREEKLYLLPR